MFSIQGKGDLFCKRWLGFSSAPAVKSCSTACFHTLRKREGKQFLASASSGGKEVIYNSHKTQHQNKEYYGAT